MKVFVNTRVLGSGITGVQRYVLELVSRWGSFAESVAPRQPLHGVHGHLWEQLVLPRLVKVGCLFSPSNTGPLLAKRHVVTLHDIVPIDHPEWLNPRFASWYRFLTPRLARGASHVVTDSEFTKQRIVERIGLSEDRISVIYLGVDSRFHPRPAHEVVQATASLSLPMARYVLCVGSLEPRKNLARLLEAWRRVSRDVPEDVWLVISGARGSDLIFSSSGYESVPPRVHFTGRVSDELLPALYSGALAFAYPSIYEGFGLPPLEAMACGVPVLTGNRTALPEVVGNAGLMVDPHDSESIAEGLYSLLTDPLLRQSLSKAGRERANKFTWDRTANETRRVIVSVYNGS